MRVKCPSNESPTSYSEFDIFQACAIFHLCIRYVIERADLKTATQATCEECPQAVSQASALNRLPNLASILPAIDGTRPMSNLYVANVGSLLKSPRIWDFKKIHNDTSLPEGGSIQTLYQLSLLPAQGILPPSQ